VADSAEKYRMLFDNAGDPVLVNKIGPDGNPSFFYEVNETAVRKYGYTKEQLLKMKPKDIIAGYDEGHADEIVNKLEEYRHISFETVVRHFSGAQSPVDVNVHQFDINNEKVFLTTVRDISERKNMEKAIIESEMYYKALTEESSDVIMVMDENGLIKYASRASVKVLGYTPAELEGRPFSSFSPGFKQDSFMEKVKGLPAGVIENSEVRAKTKDNRLTVLDLTIKKMFDDPVVRGIVLNMRDITERKKTEDRMKKVIWQLEQTNSELEQFAYVASHDLKEPLRMISNYLGLIKIRHKSEFSGETIEFMDFALSGTKRMFELIQALLTYSRIGRRNVETDSVNLNNIIDLIAGDFSAALDGGKIIHDDLPVIRANKIEMVQLFTNLIGNAVKFRSEKPPVIHVAAEEKEEDWVITVSDNGIGLDKQYEERVFGLFERLHSDDEYPGTGIGLTICKKIVVNLGGAIWIESEPGQGTKVKFTIPIRRETNE
ncbi:MAG: PAS domain S-box protein, partial [Candidatus Goldbacteria bacterium]|nr:PAS domain S-box protein [Candidatus Goldiibacteriota bacterium]